MIYCTCNVQFSKRGLKTSFHQMMTLCKFLSNGCIIWLEEWLGIYVATSDKCVIGGKGKGSACRLQIGAVIKSQESATKQLIAAILYMLEISA